jgi:hypothetical protein
LSDRRDEFPHRFYGDADPQETITMSPTENKKLIQRSIQAVDDNQTSDWSILDEYIAEDFVAHNPAIPGVSLDREGMKQAADGKIVEYWSVTDVGRVLQQVGALPGPG